MCVCQNSPLRGQGGSTKNYLEVWKKVLTIHEIL